MSYMQKRWMSAREQFIIQEKYHSQRNMPKNPLIRERRRPRSGAGTPDEQKMINLRHRTENLTKLIMDNFQEGDWWVAFTLKEMVGVKKFKDEYGKMLRRLRTHFHSLGQEFKYIAVQENLEGRGRLHGHILIAGQMAFSEIKRIMGKVWKLGDCHAKPYAGDATDARGVAKYMTKQDTIENRMEKKEGLIATGKMLGKVDKEAVRKLDIEIDSKRSVVCPSKNLIRTPTEKKEIVRAETYREEIKAPKGYRVVKELSYNGWTADGYPYQHAVFERCNT